MKISHSECNQKQCLGIDLTQEIKDLYIENYDFDQRH